jgi:HEAT repeat protein
MEQKPTQIPFNQVIQALLDENRPFQPRYLYRLSDLSQADLKTLASAWVDITPRRRQAVMEDILDLTESDFLLNFSSLSQLALKDLDPMVRMLAIQSLGQYEEPVLADLFMDMMVQDTDIQVRAASAAALGEYVYLGEIEEIPEQLLHKIEDCLLKVTQGQDAALVRRRALEALGFSSREEIPPLIEAAYHSEDREWLISALFAMGRSYNQVWEENVIAMLEDHRAAVRAEAAEAAGELSLKKASPKLFELLDDEDDNVRAAAIWSLSEIGGEGVRDVLGELLDETEDEEEAGLLEDALDNLEFVEETGGVSMMDLSEDEALEEDDLFDEEFEDSSDEQK